MSLLTDLKAYYKLDESSGNAADSSGNGYTLTNQGSMTYSGAAPLINNGADINATGTKFVGGVITGMAITGTSGITLNAWAKGSGIVSGTSIIGRRATTGTDYLNYGIDLKTSNGIVFSFTTGTVTYHQWQTNDSLSTLGLANGSWHMITITYTFGTGSSIVCYVDGVSKSGAWFTNNGNATHTDDANQQFGVGGYGNNLAGSHIADETGVWTRALTASEVTSLYNGGAGLAYPLSVGIAYTMVASVVAFTLTGIVTEFLKVIGMIASVASFTLTGINALFEKGKGMVAEVASFIFTGKDVKLRKSGWEAEIKNTASWTSSNKNSSIWTAENKS